MTTSTITLEAKEHDAKKGVARDMRRNERIPGVLYGHKVDNQPLSCEYQTFHKVFQKAGESTMIDLKMDKKTVQVLIHQLDVDPVTGKYTHIDFYAPDMTKEITTNVPLRTVGESLGVKEEGGILITHRETLTVKCLPKDLPHDIEVDISSLNNIGDHITVSSITVPSNVTVQDNPEEMVLTIIAPRKEEEETPVVAEGEEGEIAEGEAPEGEAAEEKQKEGEETAQKKEGEATEGETAKKKEGKK